MKIIQNWRDSWKWVSMQAGAFQIAIQGSIATGVAMIQEPARTAFISAHAMQYVYFTIAVTFIQTFGRLVQQQPVSEGAQQAQEVLDSLKAAQKQLTPIAAGQADLTVDGKPKNQGGFMRHSLMCAIAIAATAAVCLTAGCASQQQLDSILHDIQGCKRIYQGGTGGTGLSTGSFTFQITCEPAAGAAGGAAAGSAVVTPAAKPSQ